MIGFIGVLYSYTQLQLLITAHNRCLSKALSGSYLDDGRLLLHCGWLVNFLAADQFTLSVTGLLSDL
jgi:hypothetical protein